jgi:ribosomal-protein-alanine N-acetyltransferase
MLKHIGTNSIETLRLKLRRFDERDAKSMYDNWAGDPEVVKYLPWGPHKDSSVSLIRIQEWMQKYAYPNYYNWAICLKNNDTPIGSISVEIQNDTDLTCEVGYCLGRDYWSRGIMTEALRVVMHYLFYEVGYERIRARHDVLNVASGRVMQKCGMQFEKILYHVSKRRDGSSCDCAVYSKGIRDDA